MRIIFIRHGSTAGNLSRRYIGKTDEPLCEAGIAELSARSYPQLDCGIVLASPMRRCIETARLIFPNREPVLIEAFSECDFGDFEGRNFAELDGDEYYRKWVDSGGTLPFPNGEAPENFKARCVSGFEDALSRFSEEEKLALVVHGGTIMAILEKFAVPKRGFYDYQAANGHGFIAEFLDGELHITEEI